MSKTMKIILALLIVCFCMTLHADEFTKFDPTNATPQMVVPGGWAYDSDPGTFFWSGMRFGFGVVCVGFLYHAIRNIAGDDREEL